MGRGESQEPGLSAGMQVAGAVLTCHLSEAA